MNLTPSVYDQIAEALLEEAERIQAEADDQMEVPVDDQMEVQAS